MKRIAIILFVTLISTSMVMGDEIDDSLPPEATEQINAKTRQMISAGIPKEAAIRVTGMMVQNQFHQEQTIQAQNIVLSAAEKDLPVEPIINKIFEGVSKKVPAALSAIFQRYSSQLSVMNSGSWPSPPEPIQVAVS